MAAGVRSAHARLLLADLMAAPPELRRAWLVNELDPRDFAEVTRAAADVLGTPYGIWQDDPVGFMELVLGMSLYDVQVDIAESVEANERTAVPSCADAGKSTVASGIVLWWGSVYPIGTAKVITTATRNTQVERELWPHIRSSHARAGLPGRCMVKEWKAGPRDFPIAYGHSPADWDETAFSGIHAPYLLALVDEAGGISPTIGRSLEGMMTHDTVDGIGKVRQLLIGNPGFDELGTPWFEERCDSSTYNVIHIPASKTPNFTGHPTPACRIHPDLPDHPIAAHLVSKRWVDETARDYGTDDPYYVARVDARFPKDLANKVIPRSIADGALLAIDPTTGQPEPFTQETGPDSRVALGVDPAAGGGDELAISRLAGGLLRVVYTDRLHPAVNPHDVAGIVLTQIEEALVERRRLGSTFPLRVKVEFDGGIGWAVARTLKAWGIEGRFDPGVVRIVEVTVGASPETKAAQKEYANVRAEMWWTGRANLQPTQIADPDTGDLIDGPPLVRLDVDETVLRQLSAPRQKWATNGRKLVEAKAEMRQRGVKSPDRADSALLAIFEPRPSGRGGLHRYRGSGLGHAGDR